MQDIRYGIRLLMSKRGFTAVAIIALALGIGANTAIFSVVNAVLIRPLPYIDPERMVVMESGKSQAAPDQFGGVSPADFWQYQDESESLEQLVAISGGGFSLTGVDAPETFSASRVSTNFFDALKVKPVLGRAFISDDGSIKSPETIILSHELWKRRFNADPEIIGKPLGNTGATVAGVMPADFKFPVTAEVWMPLLRDSGEMRNRANRYFNVVGLLKAGHTLQSAEAELKTLAARLETDHAATNRDVTVRLVPFRDRLVRDVKPSLLILLGAVGFVLLIACANVANLLLARAVGRRKEMAIRLALGASRLRLMRQVLTESLILGIAASVVGLLLALWGIELLVRLLPEEYAYLRLQEMVSIDARVLLFTLGVTLATSLLFGLLPAWHASQTSINDQIKDGTRATGGLGPRRARGVLMVAEIAIAMVLLVSAGLLVQSFVRMRQADLGFDSRNLFTLSLQMPFSRYPDDPARARLIKRVLEQVEQTPGVEAVASSSGTPFPFLQFAFTIEGRAPDEGGTALYDSISPNYFDALKAQFMAGRRFSDRDNAKAPAVAIVNESLARRYFGGEDATGKRIAINYLGQTNTREIVGVVKDLNQGEAAKTEPQIYVPYEQQSWLSATLIARAAANPESVRRDVHKAVLSVDKDQTLAKVDTAEQALNKSLAEPRLYMSLLAAFAALALLLAAVGVYGVMSYSVAERTHEIGVRMALGAQVGDVMKMVINEGLRLASAGVAVGLVGAFLLTRIISSLLYRVSATDPVTFVAISVLLVGVALGASFVPAWRATKVDPVTALKHE
jgi:putative ABC transport system permease protein